MTAISAIKQHIEQVQYEDLPDSAIDAAKTFIYDSIGVGLSGSNVARMPQVKALIAQWGQANHAQVWVTGEWLPANAAALINGYQIHNQEWDCVHEEAVVHPMAVILAALIAYGQKENVSGKQLVLGVTLAVDVATLIGMSVTSGLKFFRPAVCGALGATAGICAMLGIKGDELTNALGATYSQLSGTMQAHVEGSPMLALQIGLNAANAINGVDLARAGFESPKDILEGPYGFFNLFEDSYDLTKFNEKLGKTFQIEQVSHKPYPTGRAGHGGIDGVLTLQQQHQFDINSIQAIRVKAPPLIKRLVGRPAKANMDANYAKLCNGYVIASALITGSVTVADFTSDALNQAERLSLAAKVETVESEVTDPNALAPVEVSIVLDGGQQYQLQLPAVLGHPNRPFSPKAQQAKFVACCQSACYPFTQTKIDKLINRIDAIDEIQNINELVLLMINSPQEAL